MKNKLLFILGIIVIMLLSISCSSAVSSQKAMPISCYQLTQDYRTQVEELAQDWDDINKLAGNTPRMQLAILISKMQDVRTEFNNLDVPDCANETQSLMLNYMDATIDGYMSFLADEDDYTVQKHFESASHYFNLWSLSFADLYKTPIP